MSMIDAHCVKCGEVLVSWMLESGDCLIVEPCKNGCDKTMEHKFETDEDFEEGE